MDRFANLPRLPIAPYSAPPRTPRINESNSRTLPRRSRALQSINQVGRRFSVVTNALQALETNAAVRIPMMIESDDMGWHNAFNVNDLLLLNKRRFTDTGRSQHRVCALPVQVVNYGLDYYAAYQKKNLTNADGTLGDELPTSMRMMGHCVFGGRDGATAMDVFREKWNLPGIVFSNEGAGYGSTNRCDNPHFPRFGTFDVGGCTRMRALFMPTDPDATHYRVGDRLYILVKEVTVDDGDLYDHNDELVLRGAGVRRCPQVSFWCMSKPSLPAPVNASGNPATRVDGADDEQPFDLRFTTRTFFNTKRYHTKHVISDDGIAMRVVDSDREVLPNESHADVAPRDDYGAAVLLGRVTHPIEIPCHDLIRRAWRSMRASNDLPFVDIALVGNNRRATAVN